MDDMEISEKQACGQKLKPPKLCICYSYTLTTYSLQPYQKRKRKNATLSLTSFMKYMGERRSIRCIAASLLPLASTLNFLQPREIMLPRQQ